MGMLRDLIERRHQDARDQTFREFDTYKSILSDTRPEEAGGFSREQKSDALQRIVGLSAPSKKHAQIMEPLFRSVLGIEGGQSQSPSPSQPMGMIPTQSQSQPQSPSSSPSQSPSQFQPSGPAPVTSGSMNDTASPSESMSPNVLLHGTGGSGSGEQNYSPMYPASSMGAPPSPQTQPSPQSQSPSPSQTQTQTPPQSPPQSQSQTQPRGTGIQAFPTRQDQLDRMKQIADFNTDMKIREMQRLQPAEQDQMKRQLQFQMEQYKALQGQGMAAPAAAVAVGWKLPSGAFTSQTRPVNSSAYIERINPETNQKEMGYYTAGGVWNTASGGQMPKRGTEHVQSVADKEYEDKLAAKAMELGGIPVTSLTAEQRNEATSSDTAALRTLQGTVKGQHPDWTPEQVKAEAAKMYQRQYSNNQRAVEVRIVNGQNQADEVGNRRTDAESIADGIVSGNQPPDLAALGRNGQAAMVRAILQKKYNFNLVDAHKDWLAVQSHIRTMNGPTIQRQVQALVTVQSTLPMVREAYENWKAAGLPSGFSDFNSLALTTAMRLPGPQGVAARELNRQVTDFSAELGSVYMQGNANTDHSLDLAKQNLAGNWNSAQFEIALQNVEKFSAIRLTSIKTSPVVQNGTNRYGGSGGSGGSGDETPNNPNSNSTPTTFSSGGYNYTDVTAKFDPQYIAKLQENQLVRVPDQQNVIHILKKYQGKLYEVVGGGK